MGRRVAFLATESELRTSEVAYLLVVLGNRGMVATAR
jgi:hypothetical protein